MLNKIRKVINRVMKAGAGLRASLLLSLTFIAQTSGVLEGSVIAFAAGSSSSSSSSSSASSSSAGTVADQAEEVVDALSDDSTSVKEKTNFLMDYIMSQREPVMNFIKKLLIAIIIFYLGTLLIKLILNILNKSMKKAKVEISVHKFVLSFAKAVLYILLIFVAAGILGIGGSSIVAIVGSAGLTIGLALQGSLSNFAGGVLILVLKPFRVGDYIVTSSGEGTVTQIDIFYTRLLTVDNKVTVLPNGLLSNQSVVNVSRMEDRYLIVPFMVSTASDYEAIKKTIMDQVKKDDIFQDRAENTIVIDNMMPSYIKSSLKVWVSNKDYWPADERAKNIIRDALLKYRAAGINVKNDKGSSGDLVK
ncbi:MAG: mechanosensitive ion channel family protein [Lachnospiraceae bacterium]|jgi:small conductance mechanosensitive channel|nr:mechanosensitive ion channel family protein [Lachnospiraceae bacterium]MEE3461414.1 mechanosensitive ion channel family protein [Lachnospiraceae bacterium]